MYSKIVKILFLLSLISVAFAIVEEPLKRACPAPCPRNLAPLCHYDLLQNCFSNAPNLCEFCNKDCKESNSEYIRSKILMFEILFFVNIGYFAITFPNCESEPQGPLYRPCPKHFPLCKQ